MHAHDTGHNTIEMAEKKEKKKGEKKSRKKRRNFIRIHLKPYIILRVGIKKNETKFGDYTVVAIKSKIFMFIYFLFLFFCFWPRGVFFKVEKRNKNDYG